MARTPFDPTRPGDRPDDDARRGLVRPRRPDAPRPPAARPGAPSVLPPDLARLKADEEARLGAGRRVRPYRVTPYLVIPLGFDDDGTRPRGGDAIYSISVQNTQYGGPPSTTLAPESPYAISALVANRGLAAVMLGIAECYVGRSFDQSPGTSEDWWTSSTSTLRLFSFTSFEVKGRGSTTIRFPHLFEFGADTADLYEPVFVVQVYDMLSDRPKHRLQPGRDRHVAQVRCSVGKI